MDGRVNGIKVRVEGTMIDAIYEKEKFVIEH